MNPVKLIGGALIVLGLAFRAISIAYFRVRAPGVPPAGASRRRFEASRRRALLIDGAFVAAGFWVLLAH